MIKRSKKLPRDDFFGHPDILKLANRINKKSLEDFSYIYIKDKKLIKLLINNIDWLDFAGIVVSFRQKKKIMCLKWSRLL